MRRLAFVLLASTCSVANAAPQFSSLFSDHAVLQRNRPIAVWGMAAPGEKLSVSIAGVARSATADAKGNWRVELPAMKAGGPFELSASSASGRVTASDILVGDVWLCSGQSNMELPVSRGLDSWNQTQSANDPELRVVTIPHVSGSAVKATIDAPIKWQAITPQTVGDFSAACYYMARDLRRSQKVPIGAINASWGGTPIRSWLDETGAAATGGDDYDQLKLFRRDPTAANKAFGENWAAWWRTKTGNKPGQEPWNASDRLNWAAVPRITYWEQWGDRKFADFNGMVWMRKRFTLTPAEASKEATISLSVIDELDETFVNGVAVGGSYTWEAPRNYRIPAGVLRAGNNEVLVNVSDGSGAGGLSGPADQVKLTLADGTVKPLGEGWQYSVVAQAPSGAPQAPWDSAQGLTAIYNGMIAPLRDYGLTGVAWYQGEADVGRPGSYADRLGAMMRGWRAQFRQPGLPFLIVSLANFGPSASKPVVSGWADLRDQQRLGVGRDANAALVIAMDLGERLDIHPANKIELGSRLARAAEARAYGSSTPVGPEVVGARRTANGIEVEFKGVTGALQTWSGTRALAFELCGTTQESCRYADAVASGANVRLADDGNPVTRVRYAWADTPVTNLYDEAQLPPGPFQVPVN
ncbi:sialate O-acetylesterase [Sphingomonas daechungensis]|uniref:sialate O-acetylesterase n=1 Tax=Sphingomonas daechungensis TaxID=1176646 RepID=UPI003784FFA9